MVLAPTAVANSQDGSPALQGRRGIYGTLGVEGLKAAAINSQPTLTLPRKCEEPQLTKSSLSTSLVVLGPLPSQIPLVTLCQLCVIFIIDFSQLNCIRRVGEVTFDPPLGHHAFFQTSMCWAVQKEGGREECHLSSSRIFLLSLHPGPVFWRHEGLKVLPSPRATLYYYFSHLLNPNSPSLCKGGEAN